MPQTKTDPEKDSQSVDIATLSEEELEKLEIDDEGKAIIKEPGEPANSSKDDASGPDEVLPKKEVEEPEISEADSFLAEMKELKEKSEKENTDEYLKKVESLKETDPFKIRLLQEHDRVSGLQSGFHKERIRRRELEKSREKSARIQRKEKLESFQELTEEEENELLESGTKEDIETLIAYRSQKDDHERQKKEFESSTETEAQIQQFGELSDFLFDKFGFDPNFEDGKMSEDSVKEMQRLFPQDVSTKVDEHLLDLFGEDALYTAKQIAVVYDHVTRDKQFQEERLKARAGLKESIENAEYGRSKMEKLPRSNDKSKHKAPEDYSVDEIQKMGPEEFDATFATA